MFSRVMLSVATLAVAGIVAGCGSSPVTEYDAGKTALDEVKSAEAAQYAPEFFAKANDSLNAAAVEMAKQDGKFAPFRDFDRSRELIAAATNLAQQARDTTIAKKEETRLLDSALIVEIDSLMKATKSSLATAPKGKGSGVDLKVMQSDLEAATPALAAAANEVRQGRYLDARDRLQAIKAQLQRINSDIAAASARAKK